MTIESPGGRDETAAARRAAYGVVALLCALWASLGATMVVVPYLEPVGMDGTGGMYFALVLVVGVVVVVLAASSLVIGLAAVRRVFAGELRWRTLLVVAVTGAAVSVAAAVPVFSWYPLVGALLANQAVALFALCALSRPVSATKS